MVHKTGEPDIQVGGQREAAFTFHCCFCGKATISGFVCFAGEPINAKTIGSIDGGFTRFVWNSLRSTFSAPSNLGSVGEMEIGKILKERLL